MGTQIPGFNDTMRSRRQTKLLEGGVKDAPLDGDADREAAMLRLTQNQMLVNQALVEKIFACERAEEALRASEQKLHELLAHQLATREDERKRISQEIHDSLGQNLLALRMDIVRLHQHTAGKHARLHRWVGTALDNVDTTLRTVKTLIADLRPSILELGLVDTAAMELRKFGRSSGIVAELAATPDLEDLPLDEELVLAAYRALQECLENVSAHARASRVHVALMLDGDMLTLVVSDNGVGFDPTAARKPGSYGLVSLQENLSARGGSLDIDTEESAGTSITVSLPLVLANPGSSVEP